MKFISKMGDHVKKTNTLRKELHKRLTRTRPHRGVDTLHASEVTREGWCPREWAYIRTYGGQFPAEKTDACLSYTFDLGNTLQDYLTEELVPDMVVGDWQCNACGFFHRMMKKPQACGHCGYTGRMKHFEMRALSATTDISCGLDLVLDTKRPKLRLYEVKTVGLNQWDGIKAPMAEHRLRTSLYLRCLADSDSPLRNLIDFDTAGVIYMLKGYGKKDESLKDEGIYGNLSPFKEYEIKRDDSKNEKLWQRARQLKVHEEGGPLPKRICDSIMDKRCKTCLYAKKCWEDAA